MADDKKKAPKKTKAAGKKTTKPAAEAIGGALPAGYSFKPLKESPLSDLFAVAGPAPIGAGLGAVGLTAAGPDVLARVMHALGYSTVEEALGVLQTAKREIIRYLGVPAATIDAFAEVLAKKATPIPPEVLKAITSQTYAFGIAAAAAPPSDRGPDNVALLPRIQPPAAGGGPIGFAGGPVGLAVEPIGVALPASVNLISQVPNGVRNQNPRNTCIPHGTLVAYEHYLNVTTGTQHDLAEQFVWWACKQRDGIPNNSAGTFMSVGADVYEQVGVCREGIWPYSNAEVPGNVGQGPPPAGATADAGSFRVNQVLRISPRSVNDYKLVLANGRCVAFCVSVFNSSFNPNAPGQFGQWAATAMATGRITLPVQGESPIGGHCMCMVGYQDDATNPTLGGGRFIIRNSFGPSWGSSPPQGFEFGPGYGTIPYAYIASWGADPTPSPAWASRSFERADAHGEAEMEQRGASRPWWEGLDLKSPTARLVAQREPDTPAVLAGLARAAPENFRRVFGPEALADLSQALTAYLKGGPKDEIGYADLRDALEEVADKRPLKPAANLPTPSFGALSPPGPNPKTPPLPKLPRLEPLRPKRKAGDEGPD